MRTLDNMLRHILLATPGERPDNEGNLIPHLTRHGGSMVNEINNSDTEECRAFLLQIVESSGFNPVEKADLPPTVFYDSGKEVSCPCMYFEAALPEGYTAQQKFKYWKDLTPQEQSRAVIRSGHDDQVYQVFLEGMEGIPCKTVKLILGPIDHGDVYSPLMIWSWWPGQWSVRCGQEITDAEIDKSQIDPWMPVKGI